ncbi:MAG: SusC/RagA family protein, partial [Bacteroidales bacterium]|nr:SusC/RagA family protein [Bacteroidales bacterium]
MKKTLQESVGRRKTVPTKCLLSLAFLLVSILCPLAAAASIKISGTVTDENNEPLIGATVIEVGTSNGTMTDFDGNFFLDVANKMATIKVSYVGYKDQEIKVGNKTMFRVILEENITELQEAVVVGYGTQQKASVVGAINTIEPEKLRVNSTRSMTGNLAGQLAGVIAYRPTGEPGYDSSNFWIRGISSFAGGTSPLVLIDGVERSLDDI